MSEPRIFVIHPGLDGKWEVDGAHGPDDDLTQTLAILARLSIRLPVLKLTIKDDPRVGGAWPIIEDLMLEFVAVEPAAAWSFNDDAESEASVRVRAGRGSSAVSAARHRRHSSVCIDQCEAGGTCACLPDEHAPPPDNYELWWCSYCGEPSCEDSDPCQRCGEPIERVAFVRGGTIPCRSR